MLSDLRNPIKPHFHTPEDPGPFPICPEFRPMEPFPLMCLPQPVRDYVIAHAKALDADTSSIALPVLSALASAIGGTRRIRLKRVWSEPCVLWTALIADGGMRHALDAATLPLQVHQQQAFPQYRQALPLYHFKNTDYAGRQKKLSPYGKIAQKLPKPTLQRYLVRDWHLPPLLKSLADRPRGFLLCAPELDGWLGNRRSAQLETWDHLHAAGPVDVTPERNQPPVQIENPTISVTGSIQPETLINQLTRSRVPCGLVSQLLFAMPQPKPRCWTDDDVDENTEAQYQAVFNQLLKLTPNEIDQEAVLPEVPRVEPAPPQPESNIVPYHEWTQAMDQWQKDLAEYRRKPKPVTGPPKRALPHFVELDPHAKDLFFRFMNTFAPLQPDQDEALHPWLENLPAHAARLALVLHLTRWASGEEVDPDLCDLTSMQNATDLAHWFAIEAVRVLAHLSISAHNKRQQDLIDWILRKGGVVSARDVNRSSRKYPTSTDAYDALEELAKTGIGYWVLYPAGEKGGPPFRAFSLGRDFDGGLPHADPITITNPTPTPNGGCVGAVDTNPKRQRGSSVGANPRVASVAASATEVAQPQEVPPRLGSCVGAKLSYANTNPQLERASSVGAIGVNGAHAQESSVGATRADPCQCRFNSPPTTTST